MSAISVFECLLARPFQPPRRDSSFPLVAKSFAIDVMDPPEMCTYRAACRLPSDVALNASVDTLASPKKGRPMAGGPQIMSHRAVAKAWREGEPTLAVLLGWDAIAVVLRNPCTSHALDMILLNRQATSS